MATNKNAMLRYLVLDRCFSNSGKKYYVDDLLEEIEKAILEENPHGEGIKRKQLYNDMRFMESSQGWSIPLGRYPDGRKKYYRYEDLKFSIRKQPLTKSEATQIKDALQVLTRISGAPQFEWVKELIPMLDSKFNLQNKKNEIISFESNVDLKGLEHLTPLSNAINNEQVLEIQYKTFRSDEIQTHTFHPYYLKQYNSRWFLLGLNAEINVPTWNLALDRIISIKEINLDYIKTNINWEDYFHDFIGVTKITNMEVQEVKLRFNPSAANYVRTKPLHPTQKAKENNGFLDVRINVIPNKELEKVILSFGDTVEVIAPKDLRTRIADSLHRATKQYTI